MRVAILQSNYIPWKGYFDLIRKVDKFIFYDDVQFTKNDWRNRNKIKTAQGAKWLSIPCGASISRLICEVEIKGTNWQKDHWQKISECYSNASYFNLYKDFFKDFYLSKPWNNLSELNQHLIKEIATSFLGLKTDFDDSRLYNLQSRKGDRVMELLKKVGAKTYLSGPAAKSYLNDDFFIGTGIKLEWMDYNGYPEYNQLFKPFDHNVSIIDLLFNEGIASNNYMKS